jgi:hypothetical protein
MMQVSHLFFFERFGFLNNYIVFNYKFYFRGVAHPHRIFCNPQGLNHGVLLAGYDTEIKSRYFFFSFYF